MLAWPHTASVEQMSLGCYHMADVNEVPKPTPMGGEGSKSSSVKQSDFLCFLVIFLIKMGHCLWCW